MFAILIINTSCSSVINLLTKKRDAVLTESQSNPIDYTVWNELLNKHVKESGRVDYKGFMADFDKFNSVLSLMQNNHPNEKNWSKDEQLAFWINTYNAFTVKVILDNYPVEGIKKIKSGVPFINSVWDVKNIDIETATYSLNQIEHGILRPTFEEPRIHFAVNCASISCPNLLREAYFPDQIDTQLDKAAKDFLYDSSKNEIDGDKLKVSKIFNWYKSDFTKNGSLNQYLQQYIDADISSKKIGYTDYDWNLNDVE